MFPFYLKTPKPTSKLLWFTTSVICYQECTVEISEKALDLIFGVLVNKLLVVGNDGLGDSLTDGVDLGSVTTTGDANTDVDVGELLETGDQKWLVDLEAEDFRLNEVEGLSVDLDQTLASLFSNLSVFSPPRINHRCSAHISYLAMGDCGSYSQTVSISQILYRCNSFIPVFFFPKHWTL
jgi:hypothetical protein